MLRVADRIRETTTSIGTGAMVLAGAVAGFAPFSSCAADGDSVPYCIALGPAWEVGVGTFSGGSVARTTVLASSNAGALVDFGDGVKEIFLTLPAVAAAGALLPVPFATSVGLQASAQMPQQTVTGVLAFTPNATGPRDDVSVQVDLIANGVHVPTFAGFREWDGSSGYVNSPGVRNCITFFMRAGVAYYCINQRLGAAPEPGSDLPLRIGTRTSLTETGDAAGWLYEATAGGWAASGTATVVFAAGVDGLVTVPVNFAGTGVVVMGVAATAAGTRSYATIQKGMWLSPSGCNLAESGTFTFNAFVAASGDSYTFQRTGSNLVVGVWRGGVWSAIHTFTAVSTGLLYFGMNLADDNIQVLNPRHVGLQ